MWRSPLSMLSSVAHAWSLSSNPKFVRNASPCRTAFAWTCSKRTTSWRSCNSFNTFLLHTLKSATWTSSPRSWLSVIRLVAKFAVIELVARDLWRNTGMWKNTCVTLWLCCRSQASCRSLISIAPSDPPQIWASEMVVGREGPTFLVSKRLWRVCKFAMTSASWSVTSRLQDGHHQHFTTAS
jgi:hypothetical protein